MRGTAIIFITVFVYSVSAQEPLGIFDNHLDLGDPAPGKASFQCGHWRVRD